MAPSYSDPEDLYQKLDQAGMTYKTLTDLNTIQGCLDLLHHGDVFISEEVSTFFQDGCRIHLLVWNISEVQHGVIQQKRSDLFALIDYLKTEKISYAVTELLHSHNQKLKLEHLQFLLDSTSIFEVLNTTQEPLAQKTLDFILDHRARQGSSEKVIRVAGSNDSTGLQVAGAYTEVENAVSIDDFFEGLKQGRGQVHGSFGTPFAFARGIYGVLSQVAQKYLSDISPSKAKLTRSVLERLVKGQNPIDFTWGERFSLAAEMIKSGQVFNLLFPRDGGIARILAKTVQDAALHSKIDQLIEETESREIRVYQIMNLLMNEFGRNLLAGFRIHQKKGRVLESLQSLGGLLPAYGVLAPYFFAFYHHHVDRKFLQQVSWEFTGKKMPELRNLKRAWFTDTLDDVNGVSRTIGSMARAAQRGDHSLTVITSRRNLPPDDYRIKNFEPLMEFEMPLYQSQMLSLPPVLEMIEYIHREQFTELIISTTGPVGYTALLAGKLLGIPMTGIYHTDFPKYTRILSGDDAMMEQWMWRCMDWFYGKMDLIYCNSDAYRKIWRERGIPAAQLEILPRGLDAALFHPRHRQNDFWKKRGASGAVLLYVGRVSKEKELMFLVEVMQELHRQKIEVSLAVVGDGPYLAEMQKSYPQGIYTGALQGDELAVAYASADLFVFPSTTDTFGNVVIEAMAAGLPTLVSDIGGPCELILKKEQGSICKARDLKAWVHAIQSWIQKLPDESERYRLADSIHQERNWDSAFEKFWNRSDFSVE